MDDSRSVDPPVVVLPRRSGTRFVAALSNPEDTWLLMPLANGDIIAIAKNSPAEVFRHGEKVPLFDD